MRFLYTGVFLLCLSCLQTNAQEGRFKIGGGAHYISNNYPADHLYDFGALSVNTSYLFWQQQRLSVNWEQQVVLRHRQNDEARKTAFIATAPLVFRYQGSRKGIYLGAGPGYLHMGYRSYAVVQKESSLQLQAIAGIVFPGKWATGILSQEWHIRAGVFRSLTSNHSAPHISVLLLLGAKRRVPSSSPVPGTAGKLRHLPICS